MPKGPNIDPDTSIHETGNGLPEKHAYIQSVLKLQAAYFDCRYWRTNWKEWWKEWWFNKESV